MASIQVVLDNKAKYISEILADTLDLRKKTKDQINTLLSKKNYTLDKETNDYKYLIKMPMDSVSQENVDKLLKEKDENNEKIVELSNKTAKDIWLEELEDLKKHI